MLKTERSEIITEKIVSFISNPKTQKKFLKLSEVIDKLYRRKLGKFFDEDRHSMMQLMLDCFTKIASGERRWDYEKVKIEAVIYNAARSLIGNELKKEIRYRNKLGIHLDIPRTTDDYDIETEEDVFDYSNKDGGAYNSGLNSLCDKETIKLVQIILKKDKTALRVMEELMQTDKNKEIAERLKMTVKEVANAKKRICRAGEKVLFDISEMDGRSIEEIRREILRREI